MGLKNFGLLHSPSGIIYRLTFNTSCEIAQWLIENNITKGIDQIYIEQQFRLKNMCIQNFLVGFFIGRGCKTPVIVSPKRRNKYYLQVTQKKYIKANTKKKFNEILQNEHIKSLFSKWQFFEKTELVSLHNITKGDEYLDLILFYQII